MNTRKQILVALFIAISMVGSVADAASQKTQSSQSFDQLYASVMTVPDNTHDMALAVSSNSNALIAFSVPTTHVATPVTNRTITVTVSGYNSEVGQTDDSPFIMANGDHVHDGAVAANIIDANGRNIPFGTLIKIPSLYGDKIFVVEDRLNKRYTKNVDIWFTNRTDALKLGRRVVQIEIIK